MKPIINNWLHWQGKGWHAGYQRYGKGWSWQYARMDFGTCVTHTFWRFFVSFDKPAQKS